MTGIVEAACPGCKKLLRIPSNWIDQPLRCKHCGMVVSARVVTSPTARAVPVAAPAAAPRTAASPIPVAMPVASPHALAIAQPASVGTNAFSSLDEDAGTSESWRRRRRRARRRAIVGLFVLAAAALATMVFWPQIKDWVGQAKAQIAALDEAENTPKELPKTEKPSRKVDPPIPSDSPKEEQPEQKPPKKEQPKKEQTKDVARKDPPKKETPKKDPPRKETPVEPSVRSTSLFPRRALAISVNNYLFLNPINYGAPNRRANSVRTLLERFTTGLRVPAEQVFELSDAAPMGRARSPVKAAIEKAVTEFTATSRPQDRIVLLLVAHTVQIEDEAYIIPVEGDQESKDRLIPLACVYAKLAAAPARQKILILDTCRFNPTRGQERPGGGPMNEKLDAKLKEPPPGVQVWTACVAGQHSFEFDSSANGNVNNGLFLDCLQQALVQGVQGTQRPDESIRLDSLVNGVNGLMKAELAPLKLEQTSRLSGQETEGGAAYNATLPPAVRIVLDVPPPTGEDVAPLAEISSILAEIDVPPLRVTPEGMAMRAESMPPFSAKLLAQYKDDGGQTPLRAAVAKARKTLHEQLKGKHLREEWQMIGDENGHKAFVKDYQEKEVAKTIRELEEARDELRAAGKEGRKEEKSKRWQANYDYVLARMEAQIAYLYEYDSALGEMRKELPEKGPNGWRLASQQKLSGDPAGRKLFSESSKILDKLAKDHPGTPWELLAKRDRLTNLGLKWQPNK
jgi:hypothetical protein